MKCLIVNADDLGANQARNDGIMETIEAGVVTSVSILANGPAFTDAVRRLKALTGCSVSCGLHFNVSEGRPLAPPLPILTGPDGCFRGKAAAYQILRRETHHALAMEIRRELSVQLQTLAATGTRISHLDGHQHVHVFPAAFGVVAELAEANGIRWIRLPEEPPPRQSATKDRDLWEETARFSSLAAVARSRLPLFRLLSTDHFCGLYLKNRLTVGHLRKVLKTLPEGLTELMVHPGRVPKMPTPDPFAAFSGPWRERELQVLTSPDIRLTLTDQGIRLVPFPEPSPC